MKAPSNLWDHSRASSSLWKRFVLRRRSKVLRRTLKQKEQTRVCLWLARLNYNRVSIKSISCADLSRKSRVSLNQASSGHPTISSYSVLAPTHTFSPILFPLREQEAVMFFDGSISNRSLGISSYNFCFTFSTIQPSQILLCTSFHLLLWLHVGMF